jgi:peptide/nickel transport system permease protein/oligopeptide transport system permease protein
LVHAVIVIVGVFVVVFAMVHLLPGDPVQIIFSDAVVPEEQVKLVRHQLGLDLPLPAQFGLYLQRALRGDLGRSIRSNRPVSDELARVLPHTGTLAVAAMGIAVVAGVVLGTLSAVAHNTWRDAGLSTLALLGVSFPVFWTGLLFMWLFGVTLNWLPVSGQGSVRHLVMPAATLGWYAGGILTRLTRSGMLEVLRQEYVTTARAKGLAERTVLARHALRNALIPVITVATLQFGGLLGGAVVVETVFARDGLGRFLVTGILQKDFPVVQGAVLLVALMYTLVNLAADISYSFVDPRIRYA